MTSINVCGAALLLGEGTMTVRRFCLDGLTVGALKKNVRLKRLKRPLATGCSREKSSPVFPVLFLKDAEAKSKNSSS